MGEVIQSFDLASFEEAKPGFNGVAVCTFSWPAMWAKDDHLQNVEKVPEGCGRGEVRGKVVVIGEWVGSGNGPLHDVIKGSEKSLSVLWFEGMPHGTAEGGRSRVKVVEPTEGAIPVGAVVAVSKGVGDDGEVVAGTSGRMVVPDVSVKGTFGEVDVFSRIAVATRV